MLSLLLALALLVPFGQYVRQPGPSNTVERIESFNNGQTVFPGSLSLTGAFAANEYGYYLPAGRSGTLTYTITKPRGRALAVALWLYLDPNADPGTVTLAYDGGPQQRVGLDASSGRIVIPLPGEARAAGRVALGIRATNRSPHDRLVLDQLEWSVYDGQLIRPPSPLAPFGVGLLAAVVAFALVRPGRWSPIAALGVGAITTYALAARLRQVQAFSMTQLDPDAQVYRLYADRFQWWPLTKGLFCGCYSEREPFFPLVGHLAFSILGSTDFHLRIVSLTFSTLAVALAIAAARRLVSWPLALAVGAVMAASAPLAFESVRGLRTELEMCLLLTVFLVFERPVATSLNASGAAAGVASAALALTRTFFVPVIAVAAVVGVLARARSLRRAALPIAIALVIPAIAVVGHRLALYEVPHRVNYAALHDFQFDTAGYNRWNANVEKFDQGRPLPHPELFPTLEEYRQQGPYSGPPLSTYQYLFVIHTPQEVFHDTLAGYVDVWSNTDGFISPIRSLRPLDPLVDTLVRWLGLAGLVGLVLTARRQPIRLLIPAMIVSALAFAAFAYHRELTERYRHTIQSYPLFLTAGAWVLEVGMTAVWARVRFRDWPRLLTGAPFRPWALALLATIASLLVVDTGATGVALFVLGGVSVVAAASAAVLEVAAGAAAVLAVSGLAGPRLGVATALLAGAGVLIRRWPEARRLGLAGAPAAIYALSLLVSGAGSLGWHPSRAAIVMAGIAVAATVLGAVAARVERPMRFLAAYTATAAAVVGLIVLDRQAPPIVLGGALAAVAAPAVPAAAWLWVTRRHLIWMAIAIVCTVGTTMALPLLGAVAAVTAAAIALARPPGERRLAIVVGLALVASLGAVMLEPAAIGPAWRTYLADPDVSAEQTFTSVPPGTDRLFIYARRASADTSYHATLEVDGHVLTTRLESQLPVGAASWIAVPLAGGNPHKVAVHVTGRVDTATHYIELAGVYGRPAAVSSDLLVGDRSSRPDLSLDPGYQQGTLLILPGTAAGPYDYGLRLPGYTVRAPLDLPLSVPRAGEERSSTAALADSGSRRLATAGLQLFASRPALGAGVGGIASAFSAESLGDGLTARTQIVQSLAEQGVVGLIALLLAAAAVGAAAIRAPGARLERSLVALTMLAGLLVEAPLAAVFSSTAWWLLSGWLVSAARTPVSRA